MHSLEGSQSNVPAFLVKLWTLVDDPESDNLIKWGSNETSFIIRNQAEFAKELLPLYFKHNNMASFIRQLNMYGFRKITNVMKSSMRNEDNEMEFYHPCFAKQRKELLPYIKRKTTSSTGKVGECVGNSSDTIQDILTNVKELQVKQENLDSVLLAMTQENEALWREIALLRQKHAKQQQIVAKLIQFLLSIVQPTNSRRKILKRKLPLMIQEGISIDENQLVSEKLQKKDSDVFEEQSLTIRDVTDNLDNEALFSPPSDSAPCSSTLQSPENVESSLVEFVDNMTSPILDSNINPTATLEELNVLESFQVPHGVIDPNADPIHHLPLEVTDANGEEALSAGRATATTSDQEKECDGRTQSLSKSWFSEQVDQVDDQLSWLCDQLSAQPPDFYSSDLFSDEWPAADSCVD